MSSTLKISIAFLASYSLFLILALLSRSFGTEVFFPVSVGEERIYAWFEVAVISALFAFLFLYTLSLLILENHNIKNFDRSKTEFVSFASHQLRGPITSLIWFTEIMEKESERLSVEQKESLKEIYYNARQMNALINDLLNISRIEMGSFVLKNKEIDLKHIVQSTCEELKYIFRDKCQIVLMDLDRILYQGDETITRLVVENLISNAMKYTPRRGKIAVSMKKKRNKILFTVKDFGIGIPKHQQKYIFSHFFRAENAVAIEERGTGLGLYMVKTIINNFGGFISFTSKEGEGAKFVVQFPIEGMRENTSVATNTPIKRLIR